MALDNNNEHMLYESNKCNNMIKSVNYGQLDWQ